MKKNRTSLGCLFWIALIILVLIVFLFNRKKIEDVMHSTGLLDLLKIERRTDQTPEIRRVEVPEETPGKPVPTQETPKEPTIIIEPPREIVEISPPPKEKEKQPDAQEQERRYRKSNLYFVQVDEDGDIQMRKTSRSIYFTDSPLTETMKSLIEGMLPEEIAKGYLSLIPENSRLLSIVIKEETAFMNFNESFKYNPFGQEGYIAQLKQIVYTATEFPTVKRVQFLIEGQTITYLSPEGIDISKPLSRDSF